MIHALRCASMQLMDSVMVFLIGAVAWVAIMATLLQTQPLAALLFSVASVLGGVAWAKRG